MSKLHTSPSFHRRTAHMAAKKPYINSPGTVRNWLTLTTPDLTVSVTDAPRKNAPRNSQMPAIMTACHILSALVPTDEPNELAVRDRM